MFWPPFLSEDLLTGSTLQRRASPPEAGKPSTGTAGKPSDRDGGQAGFLISRPSQIGFTFDGAGRDRKGAEKHNSPFGQGYSPISTFGYFR